MSLGGVSEFYFGGNVKIYGQRVGGGRLEMGVNPLQFPPIRVPPNYFHHHGMLLPCGRV